MTGDRISRWLDDLRRTLRDAQILVGRGRAEFDRDIALGLAFEALCNRVGDLAKRLQATDADRFSESIWTSAARNRDFVVHHDHRIDPDLLWVTVTRDFPALARSLEEIERDSSPPQG